jgi:hypothetical protein
MLVSMAEMCLYAWNAYIFVYGIMIV